jgi:hypothetical protein
MTKGKANRPSAFWTLGAILMFGLLLRILFAPGVGFEPGLKTVNGASAIASVLRPDDLGNFLSSLQRIRAELGWTRIVAELPLAFFYAFFGESDSVTRSFGLIFSVIALFMVYWVARRLAGPEPETENIASIATVFFSLIPLGTFLSVTPSHSTFWFPLTLLMAYFSARIIRGKAVPAVVLTLIVVLCLLLIDFWLGFFILLFSVAELIESKWSGKGFVFAITSMVIIAIVAVIINWSQLHTWREALLEPEMVLLIPLFTVVLVAALIKPSHGTNVVFLWLTCAITVFLGTLVTGSQAIDASAAGLLVIVGLCILTGAYFSDWLAVEHGPQAFTILLVFALLVAYLGLKSQMELIPSFDGLDWLGFHSIFLFSNIIGGLFIVFLLASAAIWKTRKAPQIGFLALALFPLAMLSPIWEKNRPFQTLGNAVQAAVISLNAMELDLRVYVTDPNVKELLAYYEEQARGSFRIVPQRWDSPEHVADGYVLALEGELQDVPKTWLRLDTFGGFSAPVRLVLYRSLFPQSAAAELQTASALASQEPSPDHYQRYYEALINAGEFCKAYNAWMVARELQGRQPSSIPVSSFADCFASSQAVPNIEFDSLANLRHYPGFIRVGPFGEDEEGNLVWRVFRRYEGYYDPRIFDLKTELDQDSFFLYSANVKGEAHDPFYTLYWRIGDHEEYLDKNLYPEWSPVSLLIYSGEDKDGSVEMRFSPVLSDNFGAMFLSQVQISRISSAP